MRQTKVGTQALELARLTRDLSRCCRAKEEELLEKFGLTSSEGRVLLCLADHAMETASSIAEQLSVSRGRLSPLVENLVQKGLVTRTESAADRRSNTLELTVRGKDIAQAVTAYQVEFHENLLAHFRPEERTHILSMLDRLRNAIEELRGELTAHSS